MRLSIIKLPTLALGLLLLTPSAISAQSPAASTRQISNDKTCNVPLKELKNVDKNIDTETNDVLSSECTTQKADSTNNIAVVDITDDLNLQSVRKEIVEEKPRDVKNPMEERAVSIAVVEQKPMFPGGDKAMYEWLMKNLRYPEEAIEDQASGKVTVQFIVEKDGSITNAKIVRGKHPALDVEALRLVKKMPNWTPGRNNGQLVRVINLIPINFNR